jgi:hypothetical protein
MAMPGSFSGLVGFSKLVLSLVDNTSANGSNL